MGLAGMVLGAFAVLWILAQASDVFGIIYMLAGLLFFFGMHVATWICAFRTSFVQGLLTFFVPFYILYFIYGVWDGQRLKVLAPVAFLVWLGIFAVPAGEEGEDDLSALPTAVQRAEFSD